MLKRLFPFFLLLILFSCKKETADFKPEIISDYFPLETGRYIDYDLDSTVFIEFGTIEEIHHYQAREVVEEAITDNAGRESYKITRYLRTNEAEPWAPSITFLATPTSQSLEVLENNLRYVKLGYPFKDGFSWKGNKYIDTYSTELNMNYMEDWDYTYDSVGVPLTIGSANFDHTIKVFERDEFLGQDPSIPGTLYAEKTIANEKYAKGVGLIYREFLHWEYQGNQPGRTAYYEGYGIKMTITGHGKL